MRSNLRKNSEVELAKAQLYFLALKIRSKTGKLKILYFTISDKL